MLVSSNDVVVHMYMRILNHHLIMIAVTPPAGLLSWQPASPDIMQQPPRPPSESLFNREIIMDSVFNSVLLGALAIVSFVIPLYTLSNGEGVQGVRCDERYKAGVCDPFFRARSTLMMTIILGSFVVMMHCRSYRGVECNWRGIKETITSRTLQYTFIFDLVAACVFMYVPGVSTEAFRILGMKWEWGVSVGLVLVYAIVGEAYKWMKRRFLKPLASHPVDELLF